MVFQGFVSASERNPLSIEYHTQHGTQAVEATLSVTTLGTTCKALCTLFTLLGTGIGGKMRRHTNTRATVGGR